MCTPRAWGHILGAYPPREAVGQRILCIGLTWRALRDPETGLCMYVGGVCEIRPEGLWHLRHTSCLCCLQTVPTSQGLEKALENIHRAFLWRPARKDLVGAWLEPDPTMCSGLHTLSCRVARGEFESPTEHLAYLLLLFLKLSYLLYNSC